MQICLITGIFPPDIGGPATYVSRLTDALVAKGHDIQVVTQGTAHENDPLYVTRISRNSPLPIRLFLIFWVLMRNGWRCDVWYINGLELPAVLAGTLLRKRMVMKIVGDYAWERAMNFGLTNDLIDQFQQTPQHWKVELHKTLRAWYTRQVAQVITPSQYLKRLVCGWGVPEHRVRVIYNAVQTLSEDPGTALDNRKKLNLPEDGIFLITVARLVSWKGIDQLIRILPQLNPHVYLIILGDGPEKNKLTALAGNLNVANRVKFPGKTDGRQVLSYLRAADIFVLNTAYEGFSHVLLEAMMVGIPIITTPVCGNPELVNHGQNGVLIPYNAPEMLADQLSLLIENPAFREKLVEGGTQTLQKFSWERLLKETLEVLTHANIDDEF